MQVRKRIGMVFQKPNPFPKSIYDNIAFGPRVLGMKGDMDEIVERALRKGALWDEVKDRLKTNAFGMSGGQQQRLCIARTMAVDPDVILMDEPCSALDPISTGAIEELMLELKQNFTIVIVTHNMQQAARVSDRTAFFNVDKLESGKRIGKLVEFAPTEKIFTNPDDVRTEQYVTGQVRLSGPRADGGPLRVRRRPRRDTEPRRTLHVDCCAGYLRSVSIRFASFVVALVASCRPLNSCETPSAARGCASPAMSSERSSTTRCRSRSPANFCPRASDRRAERDVLEVGAVDPRRRVRARDRPLDLPRIRRQVRDLDELEQLAQPDPVLALRRQAPEGVPREHAELPVVRGRRLEAAAPRSVMRTSVFFSTTSQPPSRMHRCLDFGASHAATLR